MSQTTREEKKAEAVSRMRMMDIFDATIRQFEEEDLVNVSEPPFGGLYWVSDIEKARIEEFEEKNNALVYLVVRSYTTIGVMDSYFYVSDYKEEEWDMDREDIENNRALVYVYNQDEPLFSEFGSIMFKLTPAGGLIRTA